jgi:hypothetical protein
LKWVVISIVGLVTRMRRLIGVSFSRLRMNNTVQITTDLQKYARFTEIINVVVTLTDAGNITWYKFPDNVDAYPKIIKLKDNGTGTFKDITVANKGGYYALNTVAAATNEHFVRFDSDFKIEAGSTLQSWFNTGTGSHTLTIEMMYEGEWVR